KITACSYAARGAQLLTHVLVLPLPTDNPAADIPAANRNNRATQIKNEGQLISLTTLQEPHTPNMHFVSPEFLFWFEPALKMAVTALFVSAATIVAERLGPTVGALVATLPVSAGPVYVFLALDHDAAFISASAVASLALNTATALYLTIYVL